MSLAAMPFEEELIQRGSYYNFSDDCSLYTCSAEDLIILKCYANRPQDWFDVKNIIVKNRKNLDRVLIDSILPELVALKDEPEIMDKYFQLINFK